MEILYPNDTIDCITEVESALDKGAQVLDDLLSRYIMDLSPCKDFRKEYIRLTTMLHIINDYISTAQQMLVHTREREEMTAQSVLDGIAKYFGRPLTVLEISNFTSAIPIRNNNCKGGVI